MTRPWFAILYTILLMFLVFESCPGKPTAFKQTTENKLIVISMDGLMFKQIQPHSMPFVSNFYKNGVYCPKLRPVFPTKTLVNHFSIATGKC